MRRFAALCAILSAFVALALAARSALFTWDNAEFLLALAAGIAVWRDASSRFLVVALAIIIAPHLRFVFLGWKLALLAPLGLVHLRGPSWLALPAAALAVMPVIGWLAAMLADPLWPWGAPGFGRARR